MKEASKLAKSCTTVKEELQRYKHRIKVIVEKHLSDSLSSDQYPYIVEPPEV